MTFSVMFNRLFLVYTALFSASMFALVLALTAIDLLDMPGRVSPRLPRHLWQSIRKLPLLFQLALWLLFLPLMVGLWIWQTSWPVWLRLVLVAGLAWWNVFVFFPRPPVA